MKSFSRPFQIKKQSSLLLQCFAEKIKIIKSKHVVVGFIFKREYSKEGTMNINEIYSKYYIPRPGEVLEFLLNHYQFPKKTSRPTLVRVKCPMCIQRKNNYYSLQVDLNNGSYQCESCTKKGTWHEYVKRITKSDSYQILQSTKLGFINEETHFTRPYEEIANYTNELFTNYPSIIKHYLNKYKINAKTLKDYKVGVAKYSNFKSALSKTSSNFSDESLYRDADELCMTFPRTAPCYTNDLNDNIEGYASSIVRIKVCSNDETNKFVTFDPPTSKKAGMFGYHLVPLEIDKIILTGNEVDAMAAYQETGIPATCLPNNSYQLPIQIFPLLERFSTIYIWLDDDVFGQDAAEKFVEKLGIERCLIVNSRCGESNGPTNASEALIKGKDLNEILLTAKPLSHKQIIKFESLKDAVYRELVNPEQVRGVLSNDLPALNQILKGHRLGEMTIFTGGTGTGKTTILSQLSLDYCRSGVSTLWGSFEIPNIRLAKKMLQQFAQKDLSLHPEEFTEWTNKFQQLPMYFFKFFGTTEINTVLDAMNHAIFAYDVQHIIIDNLQFMTSEMGRYNNRWELHDRTISAFRKFATDRNVHITLVVHPVKDYGKLIDIHSIFGSAKIAQEADNIIILQKVRDDQGLEIRSLDIKKNRFDGTVASIPIEFIPDSLKISYKDYIAIVQAVLAFGQIGQDQQPNYIQLLSEQVDKCDKW
ncbi:12794_t:CDS:2 [Entrophospora sp. SA101]|nr:12794_t:CDS:2 [Entrophospora sp. SA101]